MRMLLLSLCLLLAQGAWGQGPPPESLRSPRPSGWIVDRANLLSPEQELRLNERLTKLERDTGVELAIVTLSDTDGRTPKQYSTALFNHWGIGKRERNNGLLFLVVMGQRRMEVEVGDGLRQVIPDSWVPQMLTASVVPAFRGGREGMGIQIGVNELIGRIPEPLVRQNLRPLWSYGQVCELEGLCQQKHRTLVVELRSKPTPEQAEARSRELGLHSDAAVLLYDPQSGKSAAWNLPPLKPAQGKTPTQKAGVLFKYVRTALAATTAYQPPPPPPPPAAPVAATQPVAPVPSGSGWGTPWLLLGLVPLPGWWIYRRVFWRPTCPQCRIPLQKLSEYEEDAHLSPEELVEENLGSMDHEVWVCSGCEHREKHSLSRWFSGYNRCWSCGRKTMKVTDVVVRQATYDWEGEGIRTEHCENCSHRSESRYTISRKTPPSDSSSSSSSHDSSSSSSGFGGGSSSGGGGGASW